jgi:rubrerythrin
LDKVSQPEIKNILSELLKEEEEHLILFNKLLDRLEQKKEDESEEEDLLQGMDYGIFQPYQDIDELPNILDDSSKAVRLGVIIEQKAIDFYENCKEHITNKETKAQLSKIIDEERKHKAHFEDILSNLKGD